MERVKFSGIVEKPQIEEDKDKIVATWKQPKTGEVTLNGAFFDWGILKELNKISMEEKNRDRYRGMFKNEN